VLLVLRIVIAWRALRRASGSARIGGSGHER
jgi:hypothetical protein